MTIREGRRRMVLCVYLHNRHTKKKEDAGSAAKKTKGSASLYLLAQQRDLVIHQTTVFLFRNCGTDHAEFRSEEKTIQHAAHSHPTTTKRGRKFVLLKEAPSHFPLVPRRWNFPLHIYQNESIASRSKRMQMSPALQST